jgi:hypothetical protein
MEEEAAHSSPWSAGIYAGTFNGIPVVFQNRGPPISRVNCRMPRSTATSETTTTTTTTSGEQEQQHWMLRSCRFQNLCFDMQHQDFVVVVTSMNDTTTASSSFSVGLGGINPRWDTDGQRRMEWSPRRVSAGAESTRGYYQLPTDYTFVPFHSMAAHNVGHLLWDDFYPIFRLLQQWNLIHNHTAAAAGVNHHDKPLDPYRLLLMRQKLVDSVVAPLYATCDIRRNKRMQCKQNFNNFLSVMGVDASTFSTNRDFQWNTNVTTASLALGTNGSSSNGRHDASLVCASQGVAGLALLTDHGLADHGWEAAAAAAEPTTTPQIMVPHNLGHGRDFFLFREFILTNALGQPHTNYSLAQPRKRRRIVFSLESSKDWDRRLNFTQHQAALQAMVDPSRVEVQAHRLWQLSLEDQLQLALTTDVFVTVCGGGSMTATFLPRGATLVVFYNPTGGYDFSQGERTGKPARLDWDLLNNAASHLRVHWLPITDATRNEVVAAPMDADMELFVQLIRHELEALEGPSIRSAV